MIVNGIEYANYDDYKKRKENEQTNEQWFCELSTDSKAWTLAYVARECEDCAYSWEEWLKAVHKE